MAVDGLRDDDTSGDASRWSDTRAERGHGSGIDRLGAALEQRNRSECRDELREYHATQSRVAARDAADAPERTDGGGWRWKGLELDPVANRIADEGIATRREAEGRDAEGNYAKRGITPVMRRIEAELEHGSLVPDTEKFALKSPDRFKEKLAKLVTRYPAHDCGELTSAIHDGIRYTYLFHTDHYAAGVADVSQRLRAQGYELELRKPSWDATDYRGVNSRWVDSESGVRFEVQFHTSESWEAKHKTHDIYEKLCDTRISPSERTQLEREQRQITSSIPVPPGASEITHYSKGSQDGRG